MNYVGNVFDENCYAGLGFSSFEENQCKVRSSCCVHGCIVTILACVDCVGYYLAQLQQICDLFVRATRWIIYRFVFLLWTCS